MSLKVKTMAEWAAEGKDPEILFWVGSAGSFDEDTNTDPISWKILAYLGVEDK